MPVCQSSFPGFLLAALLGATLCSAAALADDKRRDPRDGRRHHAHQHHHSHRHDDRRHADTHAQLNFRFGDADRRAVYDYYAQPRLVARCPPGLAKKPNGCVALPGHTKRWTVGRPLSPHVTRYEVPRELTIRLPAPPPRHRYVRVDSDILMLAIGTGMVLDSIQNLGRM